MKKITLLLILLTVNFSLAQIVAPWGQDFNTIEAGGDNSAITDGWYQWSAAEYETNGTDIWYGWSLNPNLAPGSNGEYTLYHDDDVPDTGEEGGRRGRQPQGLRRGERPARPSAAAS